MLWLLLTGQAPTDQETRDFVADLSVRYLFLNFKNKIKNFNTTLENSKKILKSLSKESDKKIENYTTILNEKLLSLDTELKCYVENNINLEKISNNIKKTLNMIEKVKIEKNLSFNDKLYGIVCEFSTNINIKTSLVLTTGLMVSSIYLVCKTNFISVAFKGVDSTYLVIVNYLKNNISNQPNIIKKHTLDCIKDSLFKPTLNLPIKIENNVNLLDINKSAKIIGLLSGFSFLFKKYSK